jgi:hypothetical protein
MKYLYLILVLALFSCNKYDDDGLKTYIVKQGNHDFTPNPIPFPEGAKSFSGTAFIDSSCWYNNLGEDNADWNKLAGVYRFSGIQKNKDAFILAWRPAAKSGYFELSKYKNENFGIIQPVDSNIVKIATNTIFSFKLEFSNGRYEMFVNGASLGKQSSNIQFKTIGKISAYFGGNRMAPRDMFLKMKF